MTRGYLGARGEFDPGDEDYDEEDNGATCKRCGVAGLEWFHTGVRYRLMEENGKFHECKQIDCSDDFDVLD